MSSVPSDFALALARDLLAVGAVSLQPSEPFTWASGRLSPVYTDTRVTISHPALRTRIADALAREARGTEASLVAGTATAGIPHAALVADRLGLPMAYVRSAAKDHGRQNRIEGRVAEGDRVVVVEDLVSTGGSVLSAADALRGAGATPVLALAVFSYELRAASEAFGGAGLRLETLTGYDALRAVAAESLSGADLAALDAWREDPAAWSRERGGA